MKILSDIKIIEFQYSDNKSQKFIRINFGDTTLKFVYQSTEKEKYQEGDNLKDFFELIILRFGNSSKNFPYDILLIKLFKNDKLFNLKDYNKPKERINRRISNILLYFYYKQFIVCIQQREEYKDNLELSKYYNIDISTKFEKFKNFNIDGVFISQNNKLIIAFNLLQKGLKYSNAEIVKLKLDMEDFSILIAKIELQSFIGLIILSLQEYSLKFSPTLIIINIKKLKFIINHIN